MTLEEKILIAGSGGQGILFLGRVIAESAVLQEKNTTFISSYGPESRGGTSNCHVIVSDEEIYPPIPNDQDVVIAFSPESIDRFESELKENGLLLYNSYLIKVKPKRTNIEAVAVPFTEIAKKLGNEQVLNMVALGAYYELKKTINLNIVLNETLPNLLIGDKATYIKINKEAIQAGIDYIKRNLFK
ncbi:MAG: 2-oxoacid:acceptor oxidoreductase family protein [Nanoarchaeota archaeon]|nr:2-oxoacid:acceptor oxidoreductase family protein [Nanoarchaeota archaeon]